jgi:guanylate kinase
MGRGRRKNRGNLFVVSAPSGAGKTTLCRKLLEQRPEMGFVVSHTTRRPRPGEADGRDYTFVGEEEFHRIAESGGFAEWAMVHGNLYGASRERLDSMLLSGVDVLHDIDVQGAKRMRDTCPDAAYIFILPPSMEVLRERLAGRGSDPVEVIRGRLMRAKEEIRDYLEYDYVIVNDVFEEALKGLESIVTAKGLGSDNIDPGWVEDNFYRQEEA